MELNLSNKNRITILQHNVTNWKTNSTNHYNIYRQHDPDIILLNETGIKSNEEIKLFQYTCYKTNHSNELHDGVVVAIKKYIKHKLLKVDTNNCICIQLETNQGPINIATTYLPPRRQYFPYEELLNIFNRQEPTYVIADVNATHPTFGNRTTNPKGTALVQLINRGIIQNYGPPFHTWFGHTSSAPDRVLTNNKVYHNMLIEKGLPTTNDHLPILVTISTSPIAIPIEPRPNVNKTNWAKYKEKLNAYVAKDMNYASINEIHQEISNITQQLTDAIDESTPILHNRTLPTPKLPEDVKLLQVQYTALLETNSRYRLIPLENRRRINELKFQLQIKMKKYSQDMWNNIVSKINTNDSKQFWKAINRISGHDCAELKYLINEEGRKLDNAESIAEEFRRNLAEVFNDTDLPNSNFDNDFKTEVDCYIRQEIFRIQPYENANPNRHDDNLLMQITSENFKKHILTTKNKAPGKSGIMQIYLKEAPKEIIKGYCNVFNACLTTGYFPTDYKTAKIKMVLKPGKPPTVAKNYRPISLLEVPAKIFEKIINKRLLNYWTTNGNLNSQQFGFRPQMGTLQAIALATEKISKNLSRKSRNSLVLRDVSKAFDKVWHNGLRFKILHSNLPICMEKMLSNFLVNRDAFISYKSVASTNFDLKTGVPQGGCISPTLYIFYVADIPPPYIPE